MKGLLSSISLSSLLVFFAFLNLDSMPLLRACLTFLSAPLAEEGVFMFLPFYYEPGFDLLSLSFTFFLREFFNLLANLSPYPDFNV